MDCARRGNRIGDDPQGQVFACSQYGKCCQRDLGLMDGEKPIAVCSEQCPGRPENIGHMPAESLPAEKKPLEFCDARGLIQFSTPTTDVCACRRYVLCSLDDPTLMINSRPMACCRTCLFSSENQRTIEAAKPAPKAYDPEKPFDRVVCINLDRRQDRRNQFLEEVSSSWPDSFPRPMFYRAIDGQKIKAPAGYTEGNNVWACLQSHRHVIEQAINDDVNSILIFEDDAIFERGFAEKAVQFMRQIPADWEFAFLGGHNYNAAPILVKDCEGFQVVKPQHCDRMHAYAVRGKGLIDLYQYWHQWHTGHCDHAISKWMPERKTYSRLPWIVGQRKSVSDIERENGLGAGVAKDEQWWHSPESISPDQIASIPPGPSRPTIEIPPSIVQEEGPGTEVSNILKLIGIPTIGCQSCEEMVDKMNKGGTQWCLDHRREIVGQLKRKSQEISLKDKTILAMGVAQAGLALKINWLAVEDSILDEGIRRWEAKQHRPFMSCCLATRGRKELAIRSIRSFYDTTRDREVECIVASHPDDSLPALQEMAKDTLHFPNMKVYASDEFQNACAAWNLAASYSRGTWIALWDDDLVATDDWLPNAMEAWNAAGSPEIALLGLWDDDSRVLANPPTTFTRTIATRKFYLEHCNGVIAIPSYGSWFSDTEIFDRAKRAGCAIPAMKSIILHHQQRRGKGLVNGEMDETARLGELRCAGDVEAYRRRLAQGFPNDFPRAMFS